MYSPTYDALDEDVEQYCYGIKETLKLTRPVDINTVMGDFNAKVGKGQHGDVAGNYGLDTPNDRENRLIPFFFSGK